MVGAAAMAVHAVGGQIDHMTVAHAALGDDVIGEFLHIGATALEHRDLHAAFVVKMHVQCCLREIMAVVEIPRQPLRQFARLMVVEIDQRRDARPGPADFDRSLLQAGAGKVAVASERLA